jgi:hypothetical protein
MIKLTAFAVGLILVAGVISTADSATLYFDDGSSVDIPAGSKVYVNPGVVWQFTRFNERGFDIRPLEPVASVEEQCAGLTFGGDSVVCEEVVEVSEETQESKESCEDQLGFGHGC